jgi:hypothetical protein
VPDFLPFGTPIRCGGKPGEYLIGSRLLRAPFLTLPTEQNDHNNWNNTEDQEATKRFVIADRVPKYNGDHTAYAYECKPEDSALFPVHNDPNVAQGIIGVECLSFPGKTEADAQALRMLSLDLATAPYFSFTKSKTKIAHTPTVTGNCAACASRRNDPPLGIAKVSRSIATAVSIPRTNLLFQFIFVSLAFRFRPWVCVLASAAMLGRI